MEIQNTFFNLSPYYGLIHIKGSDAVKFLQDLLTCDIQELDTKDHCFGALCNLKGRVRALFRIFKFPGNPDKEEDKKEGLYLLCLKALIPSLLPVLKKHALFSKITLEDVSEAFSVWGVMGDFQVVLESFANLDPNSQCSLLTIDAKKLRYILIFPKDTLFEDRLLDKVDKHDKLDKQKVNSTPKIEDYSAWKLLDIQAGIPEVFPETAEKFLPHHLNLPALSAVSFTKGCYFGQEIIARMEYKANIRYHLKHIKYVNSKNKDAQDNHKINEPAPGTELPPASLASQPQTVVSASTSSTGDIELLVIAQE